MEEGNLLGLTVVGFVDGAPVGLMLGSLEGEEEGIADGPTVGALVTQTPQDSGHQLAMLL